VLKVPGMWVEGEENKKKKDRLGNGELSRRVLLTSFPEEGTSRRCQNGPRGGVGEKRSRTIREGKE